MNDYNNLPEQLRKEALFCLWKYEKDAKGRDTKIPYNPNRIGAKGDSTDKTTFAAFEKTLSVFQVMGEYDGLGIGIFDCIGAIDIDKCIVDGHLSTDAEKIIKIMKTYTERSPSGKGIRILFRVKPDFKYDSSTFYINNRKQGVEIYVAGSTKRFVTVTGDTISDGWGIEERTYELLEVTREYMRRQKAEKEKPTSIRKTGLSDDVILKKASAAANGEKFMQLWSGDISGYPSESEADLALCMILAFWTGNDPERTDALFRQSSLMRDKWDSRRGSGTYGSMTIETAISKNDTVYSPGNTLEPADYTDLGQAEVFVREYGDQVRYSLATKFLVYDGKRWAEDELKVQRLSQELTARQLTEAKKRIAKARAALDALVEAEDQDPEAVRAAKGALKREESFRSYVLGRRASTKVKATMTEAAPRVQIEVAALDADGYLLNTPDGTVDLRTGQMREHRPDDYCTKITTACPGADGSDIWTEFLDDITVKDADLKRYLQDVAGLCAIGAVKREELVIAIGEGSNGKSTFFNLLFRVLGDYSGMLSAETLTIKNGKNNSPEYAELRGKRLVIAAELEERQILNTSAMKKLCSTDPILAEKKFKDPFTFIPSHHVILYTNHLPKVGTNDQGTWRRLVTVPFKATFEEGSGQIKDYADYLFNHCSGSVLSWIIEGAKRVIANDFVVKKPECVLETLERYKEDSDWLAAFINDRCETGNGCIDSGGNLYDAYKLFCDNTGEFRRKASDFSRELERAGYKGRKGNRGKIYKGIRVLEFHERAALDIKDMAAAKGNFGQG